MDIEAELLSRFSTLGTTDHDVLIAEFRKFVGDQTPDASCAFFLDMNNWNLQEAIGAYYDYKIESLPQMSLEGDITTGDGEAIPPNTHFTKTWRVKNSGTETWPVGVYLQFIGGDKMGQYESIALPPLAPGQLHDINVDLISPSEPGVYQSQWQICTPNGIISADTIWVVIKVEHGGVLGITQQMSTFATTSDVNNTGLQESPHNPFDLAQQRTYNLDETSVTNNSCNLNDDELDKMD